MTSAPVTETSAQPLCRVQDIADGQAIAVDAVLGVDEAGQPAVAGNLIVLRVGETVHAYLNVCPHAGRQLDFAPGQFLLTAGTVICAVHGASFALASGACVGGPCRGQPLRRVPVKVVNDEVWLSNE